MRSSGIWTRKVTAFVLVAMGLFVIAGCGGGSSDESTSSVSVSADSEVEGSLSFWYVPTDPSVSEWWDKFSADFESKYPGASLDITENSVDNFQAKTLAAFSSGDHPDTIAMDTGEYLAKFVRAGFIGNVADLADFSYYNPAAVDVLTSQDGEEIWGVPEYSFVITLWRNAGLFEEYGVGVPKTWDELLSACETFSENGVTPIAFGDGGQDQWTAGHIYSALLYQYGGVGVDVAATFGEGDANWDDPEFVEAAARLRELADAECFPEGFSGLNYSQMSSIFQRGDAAMIWTGSWFASEVAGAKGVKVDVVPGPDGAGAANSTAELEGILAGVTGIVASKEAIESKPALVKAFLDAFGEVADEYANENGLLSVAAKPQPSGGPVQAAQTKMLSTAKDLVVVTDVAVPAQVIDEYYENLQGMLVGEKTPEDFGAGMAEAADRERSSLPQAEGTE